jgi:hypothetical protein
VILKCLEKDKNSRFADVSALAAGLQDVINQSSSELPASSSRPSLSPRQPAPPELVETRRGEMPNIVPPSMPANQPTPLQMQPMGSPPPMQPMHAPPPQHMNGPGAMPTPFPMAMSPMPGSGPVAQPGLMQSTPGGPPLMQSSPGQPMMQSSPGQLMQSSPGQPMHASYPQGGGAQYPSVVAPRSKAWILWVVGLLVFGAGAGALIAHFVG